MFAIIGLAISVGISLLQNMGNKTVYKAKENLAKANTYAKKKIREGQNNLQAHKVALANFIQSKKNKAVMENAGNAYNALSEDFIRTMDNSNSQSLSVRLRTAENAGKMAAAAASMGVAGGTVNDVQATFNRVADIQQNKIQRASQMKLDNIRGKQVNILPNAVSGLDNTINIASIDNSPIQTPYIAPPDYAGNIMKGISRGISFGSSLNSAFG